MKRIHIFLFLFVTCFILNGCGAQNPSDSGPEAKDHTTATGNAILPESTITWFNTEYFNSGDGVNMRNMLLSSQYSTIADIDLFQLFYNGIPEVQLEISDEEKNTLVKSDEAAQHLDIIKITQPMIDNFLQEYAGVNMDDTNQVGLDQFIYLEEFDAYYLIHSDTNYARCNVVSGTESEGGYILLDYEMNGRKGIVTLKNIEGDYRFISNVVK